MDRLISDEGDLKLYITFLEHQKFPYVVKFTPGRHRSIEQNRLQRLWCNEIASQWEGHTPEDVRGYLKLTIGVPIRRATDEVFARVYDKYVKPLPWDVKIAYMKEPLDFPVTRDMTTKHKTEFLEGIKQLAAEQGWKLTQPEDLMWAAA